MGLLSTGGVALGASPGGADGGVRAGPALLASTAMPG